MMPKPDTGPLYGSVWPIRISSLSPSARAAVLPNNANASVNKGRETLIVPSLCLSSDWLRLKPARLTRVPD